MFNDCGIMGIRDIAWFCEAADTEMIGGTHAIKGLVDYRTADRDPYFMPLIGDLGNAWIKEQA